MAENNIKTQVEERLVKQQESKEFKDIGRVANTKKEKSAYRLISSSVLSQLEEDSVMAYNMVKKDNVWQPIDVNLEKERGVSSGAAYLKVKIRESLPTRPKDEKQKRASYVMFIEILQKDLYNCTTVSSIEELVKSYSNFSIIEIIGIFIDTNFLNLSIEKQEELQEEIKVNPKYRIFRLLSGSSLFKKLLNEVFGSRFENMLFNRSDASHVIYKEAREKEAVTEEQVKEKIQKLEDIKQKFIKENQEKIDKYKNFTESELKQELSNDLAVSNASKQVYKNDIQLYRDFLVSYYERNLERGVLNNEARVKEITVKPDDWSWFEQPKSRSESVKEKSKAINSKTPLSYIKRTGGYKIQDISPKSIIENFGFSAVNYGVYVDDIWSKEHTQHFLGAMSDLGEMLNINLKQINELGKLAVAFGAKGRPGHLAAYYPQTKDINLTKGNGDGSLAHEWGHYFDNVIVELDAKKATNTFASDGLMPDLEIKKLFKEFISFVYKGNDEYTPLIPIEFFAKDISTPPSYMKKVNFTWQKIDVEIKSTLEETLESVNEIAKLNGDLYRTQIRVYGYILKQFNLTSYEVPMKLPTSYFYHKSAYNQFIYCAKDSKGNEIIFSDSRTKYWKSAVELFARAWETVVLKKLLDKNRASNYLVADIPMDNVISETYFSPYPQGKELEYIENIFDRIIIAVKNKFNIGPFVPPSNEREDIYLDLSKDKKTGKIETGMVVEMPSEEIKDVKFVKDDEVVKEVIEEANPYQNMNLQQVEDIAYNLGMTARKNGSKSDDSLDAELQKIIKAGHAKNIVEKAWLNGWNKQNMLQVENDFEKTFTPKTKENINEIEELIMGLELLITDTNNEQENKDIQDIIDGLKLLN